MSKFYLCDTEILGLSHSAVKVYSFLRMVNNSITHDSFYKRSNIAAHCHVSESTVVRAMHELRERGLLKIGTRFLPSGQQTSNSYILIDNPQFSFHSQKPQDQFSGSGKKSIPGKAKEHQKAVAAPIQQFRCDPAALQADLSPNALKVYSYLSLRAGKAGKTMPAKKEISADCNVSVSTVSRAIGALSAAGLIEVKRQTRMETCGNNGNSVNLYVMLQPTGKSSGWKRSLILRTMLFSYSPISSRQGCSLPSFDILPHVTGDTARTISRNKTTLKQRKESVFFKLAKRRKHARRITCPAECFPSQWQNQEFLFPCFQNIRQGVSRMDSIIGLPVIVSDKHRIVINSSFRSALHIPETGRVKFLAGRNYLQIFPDSASIPGAQEKSISAGRFNLPMDWVHDNQVKVGDRVFLTAASDCILVRPSVCQKSIIRKKVLQ
jgi:DNA-binding MarR family transcriptional regulator